MTTTRERLSVHCRWHIQRDREDVERLEATLDRPWDYQDWVEILRHRNVISFVAEHGDRVVSAMVYELHPRRIDLVRLAVHADYRRRGVASQMLRKLQSKLESHRRTSIEAGVDERDLDVLLCLRSCGFAAAEVVRGGAADGYDLVMMRYQIRESDL